MYVYAYFHLDFTLSFIKEAYVDNMFQQHCMMEHHCSKGGGPWILSCILEKALESFDDEVEFILRYLGFLILVKDNNSKLLCIFIPKGAYEILCRYKDTP